MGPSYSKVELVQVARASGSKINQQFLHEPSLRVPREDYFIAWFFPAKKCRVQTRKTHYEGNILLVNILMFAANIHFLWGKHLQVRATFFFAQTSRNLLVESPNLQFFMVNFPNVLLGYPLVMSK